MYTPQIAQTIPVPSWQNPTHPVYRNDRMNFRDYTCILQVSIMGRNNSNRVDGKIKQRQPTPDKNDWTRLLAKIY